MPDATATLEVLLRWFHFLAGITWIGLLYFFNLVNVPLMKALDGPTKGKVIPQLMPRALWWFRWGAMVTFLAGWLYLLMRAHQLKGGFFAGSYGWAILLGGILGSVMWANVWFVIWPNQKIIIQNAIDTAAGRPANPAVGPAGAKAGLASRTNVAMSVPMLFFMAAASHLTLGLPRSGVVFWIVALIIVLAVEINALKGTPGKGGAKPLATVSGTLWFGFILAAVFYIWFEIIKV